MGLTVTNPHFFVHLLKTARRNIVTVSCNQMKIGEASLLVLLGEVYPFPAVPHIF